MNPQTVRLGCGCNAVLDHQNGERRVVCTGGGFREPDELVTAAREALEECPGGRAYVVRAETVETVIFTVRPLAVVQEVAS